MTLRFTGPTWTSTHQYGQGQKNTKRKLAYYLIPKCGSMWMRSCLLNHGRANNNDQWQFTCFVDEPLDDYRKIIVLRDPVERWISNCPAIGAIDRIVHDETATQNLFDCIAQWQYDEHAAPQFDFVAGLDLSNAIWFYCDSDLSKNIESFFRSEGFTNYQVPPITNQRSQDAATVTSAGVWRRLLQVPKYLRQFQTAYQRDYDLIRSVEFYRQS